MKKNTFILSIVTSLLLVLLYFPNNSYAIEENKNIDTLPLQGINFQQIDSSICQNITQIEIPSIIEYPLAINFDVKSTNPPFKDYIYKNHKYPPIVVIYFLVAFLIALKLKKSIHNNFINRTLGFFAVTALVCFISICLAWANLLYLNNKITEKEQIDTYIKMSPYITKSYEAFLSWVWQDHPALKVNAYIISSGIKKTFLSGDILTAAKYTDYDNSVETLALREGVLLSIAQNLYQKEQVQEALIYAEKALILTGSDEAYRVNQTIRAISAITQASMEKFDQARMELIKIDSAWNDDLLNKSWAAVVSLHLNYLNSLPLDENNQPSHEVVKTYLQSFSNHSKLTAPYQLVCLYASFLEKIGQAELNAKLTKSAIENLEAVETLVKNQPSTNNLLTNSYYQQGLDFSEQKDTKKAIISLEKAHNKSPENTGINCVLSAAYMSDARDYAYFGNVDESKKQSAKAKSLCQFEGINDIAADISLANGQTYMRYGNWEKARESFKEIDEQKTLNKFKLSSQLIGETYIAPSRLAKLNEARKWQAQIPEVSGLNCYFEDGSDKCSKIEIFDDERRVGMALPNMSRIEFEENGKNLVLKDSDSNGQLDTSEITEGVNRRVLVESDGDYRLDAELLFNEKREKIDEKHYSGRVLVHIPHGVIADSHDLISKPDAYLKVSLNNTYVGQTGIINNDQTPSWNQAFVQNYRKDDCLYVSMWDYDPLDPDDRIDDFKLCDFSKSGILYGLNDKAAIQVKVEPTTLPEGVYDVKSVEQIKASPFSYSDFVNAPPKLQSMLDRAKMAEENSDTMSSIAIEVAPLIITPMLGIEGIGAKGLSRFLIGPVVDAGISKVVEYQLKNNNVEKHL